MTTFQINIAAIKATTIAASNEETRYYLKGVCVQHTPSGSIFVATDGHRMIVTRHDWIDAIPETFAPAIVPLSLIKKIKINKKIENATVTLEKQATGPRLIKIEYCGAIFAEYEIVGTFPDWRRVMPQSCDGTVAQFNPDYVAAFSEAGRILGGGKCDVAVCISHNGGSPALVRFWREDNPVQSFGVLMPVRTNAPMTSPPAWSTSRPDTKPVATERDIESVALKVVEDAIA